MNSAAVWAILSLSVFSANISFAHNTEKAIKPTRMSEIKTSLFETTPWYETQGFAPARDTLSALQGSLLFTQGEVSGHHAWLIEDIEKVDEKFILVQTNQRAETLELAKSQCMQLRPVGQFRLPILNGKLPHNPKEGEIAMHLNLKLLKRRADGRLNGVGVLWAQYEISQNINPMDASQMVAILSGNQLIVAPRAEKAKEVEFLVDELNSRNTDEDDIASFTFLKDSLMKGPEVICVVHFH